MNLLDRLAGRKLLVLTGKGGVGKSTLVATLGRILSAYGRRILLMEVDPRESLYQLFDVQPSGGEMQLVEPGLFLQNVAPRAVLDSIVAEHLPLRFLTRKVLDSPVYQHFADGAPGLKEIAVLGQALRVVRGIAGNGVPRVDLVVLDAPATGHGVSLLSAPSLVSDSIREGPLGRMAGELAEFVADPDRCGILLAAQAEEMPIQEAIELIAELDRRLSHVPDAVLVNAVYPPVNDPPAEPGRDDDPSIRLWRRRRSVNDRELRRLGGSWNGPTVQLPLLPHDRGPKLIEALAGYLEPELVGLPWS